MTSPQRDCIVEIASVVIDRSASCEPAYYFRPGFSAGVKVDFEFGGLEAAENDSVRVMPEADSVGGFSFADGSWNSLFNGHVHVRVVSVLNVYDSPSLGHSMTSPLVASIALTRSSGVMPSP